MNLRDLTQKSIIDPLVRRTAMQIIQGCEARDDKCELEAIFNAVKYGDPNVPLLKTGLKYVADPNWYDYFVAPNRMLSECGKGACAGDCDDHASLICALAGSIGFKVGLRAWGKANEDDYVHVYAVAALPKRPPYTLVVGLDTTVPESYVGWEPPKGRVLTAVLK